MAKNVYTKVADEIEQKGEPWLTLLLLFAAGVAVIIALFLPAWLKALALAWIIIP